MGPESAVRDLRQATTEPITLKASAVRVRETVTIGILDSSARLRVPQNAVVTVDIAAGPDRAHAQRASPCVCRNSGPASRRRSAPPNVAVTVRGDDVTLKQLGVDAIEASVDLTGLGAGRYTLPVRVAPSPLFGVVRVDPPQVQITIR